MREARLKQRLTQRELAHLAGVSQPWLSQVEKTNTLLDAFDFARLAHALALPQGLALKLALDPKLDSPYKAFAPPPRRTRGRQREEY